MTRLPEPSRSQAVLVGVSGYDKLHPLPAVGRNLTDLADVLTSPEGTALPASQCEVVRDPRHPGEVGAALHRAAARAQDMLLVYYAGHGLVFGPRDELYLATGATDPDQANFSAVSCAEVRSTIAGSRATVRVLVVDCCFSGRAIESTMASRAEVVFAGLDVSGTCILTGTAASQLGQAPAGATHTLFTGAMLDALRDGVPGAGPLLTLDALARHLAAEMRANGGPTPKWRADGTGSRLALVRNRAELAQRCRAEHAALDGRLRDLAELERGVGARLAHVRDRICTTLTAPAEVEALRARHSGTAAKLATGRWAAVAEEHRALARTLSGAETALGTADAQGKRLLDRRDELRGLLGALNAQAVRVGVAEQPPVWSAYRRAQDLLWTKPCDLAEATAAVAAYQAIVADLRAGRS